MAEVGRISLSLGRRKKHPIKITFVPLVDCFIILLIFFIVTASFIKEVGLDVSQPPEDKPKTVDPDKKSIVVRITSRDRIVIAQRDVDWRAVRANIERLHAENPKGAVVIQADNESNTETVAAVLDAAREAGVYDVSLATEDK